MASGRSCNRFKLLLPLVCLLWVFSSPTVAGSGPNLASVNAAAAVAASDDLLFGKNADWPVPFASITKLMTALVVLESGLDMGEWLTFEERHQEAAANAWSRIRIGSRLQRKDVQIGRA